MRAHRGERGRRGLPSDARSGANPRLSGRVGGSVDMSTRVSSSGNQDSLLVWRSAPRATTGRTKTFPRHPARCTPAPAAHAVGVAQPETPRDHPAERRADDVRARPPQRVHERRRVVRVVGDDTARPVSRSARVHAGRTSAPRGAFEKPAPAERVLAQVAARPADRQHACTLAVQLVVGVEIANCGTACAEPRTRSNLSLRAPCAKGAPGGCNTVTRCQRLNKHSAVGVRVPG